MTGEVDHLLSPQEVIEYLETRYGIFISIASLYSMIRHGDAPKPTYFTGRPKLLVEDIDAWVRGNLSRDPKWGTGT